MEALRPFYREYLTDIVDPAFESQRTQYHPDLQLGALQLLAFDGEMSQLNAVYERLGINPKEQFDAGAPQEVEARSPSPDAPPDLPPSVVPDSEDDFPGLPLLPTVEPAAASPSILNAAAAAVAAARVASAMAGPQHHISLVPLHTHANNGPPVPAVHPLGTSWTCPRLPAS